MTAYGARKHRRRLQIPGGIKAKKLLAVGGTLAVARACIQRSMRGQKKSETKYQNHQSGSCSSSTSSCCTSKRPPCRAVPRRLPRTGPSHGTMTGWARENRAKVPRVEWSGVWLFQTCPGPLHPTLKEQECLQEECVWREVQEECEYGQPRKGAQSS